MNAIGKKDPKTSRERIDPDRCAGESGVPVRAERKQVSARPAVTRVNVPAKPASCLDFFRALDAGHQSHRGGLQESHSVQFALIEHHASKPSQIGGVAEQTSVPGHSSHPARGRIVYDTAQEGAAVFFGWRNAAGFG